MRPTISQFDGSFIVYLAMLVRNSRVALFAAFSELPEQASNPKKIA